MTQRKLLAIDTAGLLCRLYYSQPEATFTHQVERGQKILDTIIQNHQITDVISALEAPVNWREKQWTGHKQGRSEKPLVLRQLMKKAPEISRLWRSAAPKPWHAIPTFGAELEADDVLATAAMKYQGITIILSDDHDLYTCLNSRTFILKSKQNTLYSADDVFREYGVSNERWPLYRAIVGDKSDGHNGIPDLGRAAGKTICTKAYNAEQAIDMAKRQVFPAKINQRLLEHSAALSLYETLATLRTNTPLEIYQTPKEQ